MLKKTALAVAVAGAAAVSLAAQADTGPTLYGKIDVRLQQDDDGVDAAWDMLGDNSRFGIQGDHDLGGGMTGFYKAEFRIVADETTIATEQRLSYVGIKGGLGSISFGRQWSAYYNHVGTHVDPTEIVGTAFLPTYLARQSNLVKYANSFGPASLELDLVIDDDGSDAGGNEEGIDEQILGASFNAGPVTVGFGYRNEAGPVGGDDRKTTGVAAGFKLNEMISFNAGLESMDDGSNEKSQAANVRVNVAPGGGWNFMVGVGLAEDDDGDLLGVAGLKEDELIWLHVNKQLSKKMRAYMEYRSDSFTLTSGSTPDTSTLLFALSQEF